MPTGPYLCKDFVSYHTVMSVLPNYHLSQVSPDSREDPDWHPKHLFIVSFSKSRNEPEWCGTTGGQTVGLINLILGVQVPFVLWMIYVHKNSSLGFLLVVVLIAINIGL
jgi:hypothetical protein